MVQQYRLITVQNDNLYRMNQSSRLFTAVLPLLLFLIPLSSSSQQKIYMTVSGSEGPADCPSLVFNQNGEENGKSLWGEESYPFLIRWTGIHWEIVVCDGDCYPLWISQVETTSDLPPCGAGSWFNVAEMPEFCGIMEDFYGACEEPVPTLSQWGLMILGLIFLIIGTVAVSEQKESTLPI